MSKPERHPAYNSIAPAVTGQRAFRVVAIGGSAGATTALFELLPPLTNHFPLPIILVFHLHHSDGGSFCAHVARRSPLPVIEVCDKQALLPNALYTAPANYHLLVERDGSLALNTDPKVNWSRPSIDVTFTSLAQAMGERSIAVILSGANSDGAEGLAMIRQSGGLCIAQDPATAESPTMPKAAIDHEAIELILPPAEIGTLLHRIGMAQQPLSYFQSQRLRL